MNIRPVRTLCLVIVVVAASACAALGGGDDNGQSVFDMEVGMCFDDVSEEEVTSLPIVDCEEPHDNEVFALIDYTETEEYPGQDEISEAGDSLCIEQFDAYVGLPYLESELEVLAITPTEESWTQDGDREIICALYNLDLSKLTGSMEGAAR